MKRESVSRKEFEYTVFLAVLGVVVGIAIAQDKLPKEHQRIRFYYDLGHDTIDVSGYPKERQAQYALFSKTCSQCHTLARPINFPIVERKDWQRYVLRMHGKTKTSANTKIAKKDAQAIVDFLVYDSKIRKVDKKAEFEASAKALQKLFVEVQQEKGRFQVDQDQRNVQPAPSYTGDKP